MGIKFARASDESNNTVAKVSIGKSKAPRVFAGRDLKLVDRLATPTAGKLGSGSPISSHSSRRTDQVRR
jgi:hypothetical protein